MRETLTYSSLLSTLYDEPAPVGKLGRGTHYSVVRLTQWHGPKPGAPNANRLHDIAIIWDEDHDTRVIDALEQIHVAGLSSPIVFIGERKGHLTVLVDQRFVDSSSASELEQYSKAIERIAQDLDDPWSCDVDGFDTTMHMGDQSVRYGIINDKGDKVTTYLCNINNLWALGHKDFKPTTPSFPPT